MYVFMLIVSHAYGVGNRHHSTQSELGCLTRESLPLPLLLLPVPVIGDLDQLLLVFCRRLLHHEVEGRQLLLHGSNIISLRPAAKHSSEQPSS